METINICSTSSSSNHIPWFWVIEALADIKQLETTILDDLLRKVPESSDQSCSTNARERLALRHLEDLFGGINDADTMEVTSISNDGLFSVSERAEDVYSHLLKKTTMSNSRALILEPLNLDIHQFILQKRTCLPKCDLLQLKEALIKGGRQQEDGRSLDQSTNGVRIQADNQGDFLQEDSHGKYLKMSTRKEIHKRKKVRFLDEIRTGSHVDIATNSSKLSTKNGEFHPMNEISASLPPENVIKIRQEALVDISVSGKKKRSDYTEEQQGLDVGKISVGSEHHLEAMELTKSELKSMERNLDPLNASEPLKGPHGRILLSNEKESTDLLKETEVQELQENVVCVDDDGDNYEHIASKRIKRSVNDAQMDHYQTGFISNNDKIPQGAPPEGSHQRIYVDEAKDGSENQSKLEISRGNDNFHDKAPSSSNEDTTIAAVKSSLSSSQMEVNQKSLETEWTEENSCIKCDRGDQLLICCVSSCPIAVHESCLSSSASFDDTGNFYCPFCSYSQAISAYREIKKKFVEVKEKADLARKFLNKFLKMEHGHKQKQPSRMLSMGETDQSRRVETTNFLNEIDGNRQQKGLPNNQSVLAGVHPQEAEVALGCSNALYRGAYSSPISDVNIVSLTRESRQKQVNNHVDSRVVGNQEPLEPSSLHCSDDVPQREATTVVCVKTSDVLIFQCQPANIPEGPSPPSNVISSLSCVGTENVLSGQKHGDVGTTNADLLQQPVNTRQGPSLPLNGIFNCPCVGTETILTDQEQSSVGTKNTDLQQQPVNTPQGTETIITGQEHTDVETVNADLQQQSVSSPRGPSPPLDGVTDSPPHAGTETVVTGQEHADIGTVNACLQQQPGSSPQEPSSPSNVNVEETSENENGDDCYEFKRRPARRYSKKRTFSSRRKKTPWSSDEEEKLKEGVQRFASTDAKNVPWRKILEFGCNVFQESRTTVDLKDKWRNICTKGGVRAR